MGVHNPIMRKTCLLLVCCTATITLGLNPSTKSKISPFLCSVVSQIEVKETGVNKNVYWSQIWDELFPEESKQNSVKRVKENLHSTPVPLDTYCNNTNVFFDAVELESISKQSDSCNVVTSRHVIKGDGIFTTWDARFVLALLDCLYCRCMLYYC